jgi:hypothetical protein
MYNDLQKQNGPGKFRTRLYYSVFKASKSRIEAVVFYNPLRISFTLKTLISKYFSSADFSSFTRSR